MIKAYRPRLPKELRVKVIEMSTEKNLHEIAAITGIPRPNIVMIQRSAGLINPKRKNRVLIEQKSSGHYFDIDKYAKKYII